MLAQYESSKKSTDLLSLLCGLFGDDENDIFSEY
jgi:hypothetical protein